MQDGHDRPLSPEERRQHARLAIDYDLAVDMEGDNVPYTGLIKDISSGGLFITTDKRHEVGEEIELRFTFPNLEQPVECRARVQWYRDEYTGGDVQAGVGVQFLDLPAAVTQKINEYIRDKEVSFYDEGF